MENSKTERVISHVGMVMGAGGAGGSADSNPQPHSHLLYLVPISNSSPYMDMEIIYIPNSSFVN